MKTGNNRKLFIGLGIGVTFAVIVESAIAYGFVGATASMGALGLIALTGLIVYTSARMLLRSYKRRNIKMLLSNSTQDEFSDGDYLQYTGAHRSLKGKPISEKDKKLIIEHIDDLMNDLSRGQSKKSDVMVNIITKKNKKLIIEHIDDLMNDLSRGQSKKSDVMVNIITEKDKKKIMEHIDELLVLGPEYGGERSS